MKLSPTDKRIEDMKVSELRELLKPYGTMYRLTMKRQELIDSINRINENEREYGVPEIPHGVFRDGS